MFVYLFIYLLQYGSEHNEELKMISCIGQDNICNFRFMDRIFHWKKKKKLTFLTFLINNIVSLCACDKEQKDKI